MNRIALFVSFIVAALGVVLLVLYVREFEKTESGGEKIKLLVAKAPIARGATITDENVTFHDVPMSYVEDRAIKWAEKQKVIGLHMGAQIQTGSTVFWSDLTTSSEERRDLSSLITPGRRGVAIKTSRDDHGIHLIKPGDYVDVFAVLQQAGDKRSAALLLQKVLVLAKGNETSPEATVGDPKDRSSEKDALLTLSLTPYETQLLQLATDKGRLAVALRNPEDTKTAELPDLGSGSLSDQAARPIPNRIIGPAAPTSSGPINIGAGGGR